MKESLTFTSVPFGGSVSALQVHAREYNHLLSKSILGSTLWCRDLRNASPTPKSQVKSHR